MRRGLIEKGYRCDPLLPYIMFRKIADKSPSIFERDYEYWKTRIPSGPVIGKLFREALEEGNEIRNKKK
jgi:hypothetical protein